MKQSMPQLMLQLLSYAICGNCLPANMPEQLTAECVQEMYKLAVKHDIGSVIGEALYASGLSEQLGEYYAPFQKLQLAAVMRYEKSNYELNRICQVLETAHIPFMPLKGSVLRNHYPAPWMRTSCDIDILVPADRIDAAAECIVQHLHYELKGKSSHDFDLRAKNGQHLELHYDLIEDSFNVAGAQILQRVWDSAVLAPGFEYRYQMPDSMFYFYHIAHMAKHFETGGCGIRSFMDLWILDTLPDADVQEREAILQAGDLLKFAETVRFLGRAWQTGGQLPEHLEQVQAYILDGGSYGSLENWVNVQGEKQGGKKNYLLYRLFLPFDVLCYAYPVLERHKWLYPVMQVVRWFKIFNPVSRSKVKHELAFNKNCNDDVHARVRQLFSAVGLDKTQK